LTTVSAIRDLSPEAANLARPVCLQGLVLYHNFSKTLFVHDGTWGIYIADNGVSSGTLAPGQRIEVQGVTSSGEFAPEIHPQTIQILNRVELPEAQPVSFDDLVSGAQDSQWVVLRGIVRSVRVNEGTGLPEFRLATGGGEVRTEISDQPPAQLEQFVDATVRVRGAVGGLFNQRRQLVAPKLFVPGFTNVFVESPAPQAPFAVPARTIASLLRYSAQGAYGHRVKVSGQVTFQQSNQALFIRDATQGLSIQTRHAPELQAGDIVEAIGFPALGEWMPILQDATVRRIGSGPPPFPKPARAAQALAGEFDTDLVASEGRLLERIRRPGSEFLVMQSDNLVFNASIQAPERELEFLRDGSQLRLNGICLVHVTGPSKRRQSFELLMRSAADIVVLRNASWWTVTRVGAALGIISAVLLLAIAWVFVLRRRVRAQTEIIRQNVQREAVLEERARIAREFHDTLEQELTGMRLQLNAVELQMLSRPQDALQDLRLAKQFLRRSLDEARRSVWDLRSRVFGNGDLLANLVEAAKPLNAGRQLKLSISNVGNARRLPGRIENSLLRIGQEAIANTVRHAHAQHLEIQVVYGVEQVSLRIHDDGTGFQMETAPSADEGHFGLLGMRERAEKLRGKFSLRSRPGSGTEIMVEIPLNGKFSDGP
jgi:signal transduction histidine kinase